MLQNISISNNCYIYIMNFIFIKETYYAAQLVDDNTCFLSSKSAYRNDF